MHLAYASSISRVTACGSFIVVGSKYYEKNNAYVGYIK